MADEYYDMECGHFAELIEGHQDKIKREYDYHISLQNGLRKQAFVSVLPHADKGFSFGWFARDFWPLPGDEATEEKTYDPHIESELFEQMMKAHNITLQTSRRQDAGVGVHNRRTGKRGNKRVQ